VRLNGPSSRRTVARCLPSWHWLLAVSSIARMEFYHQRRSAPFWVMVTLLAAWGAYLIHWPQTGLNDMQPNLSFVPNSLNSLPLLLPLGVIMLLWRTAHRDRRMGIADLLWARPIDASSQVFGKLLGALFAAGALYATLCLLTYAIMSAQFGTWLSLLPDVVELALMWLSTVVFWVAAYVLLDLLSPARLVTVIACAATFFTLNFWLDRYILVLAVWDPSLVRDFWYGPGWHFGPKTGFVLGSFNFWLGVFLGICALLPPCYRLRYRRAVLTHACTFCSLALALASAGLIARAMVLGSPFFSQMANSAQPAFAITQLTSVGMRDYQVGVTLEPDSSSLSGTATFTLVPVGVPTLPQTTLQFAHNSGLTVDVVTLGARRLPVAHQLGLSSVTISGQLPQVVRVEYHGALDQRYYFGAPVGLGAQDRYGYDWYVGPDFTYLTSLGDWYPTPQIASVTHLTVDSSNGYPSNDLMPPAVGWTRLSISAPVGGFVATTASSTTDRGALRTFVWDHLPHGLLPGALLTLCASCAVQPVPGGRIVASANIGADDARRDYGPLVTAYAAVRKVMEGPAAVEPVTVVAIPVLGTVVGGGSLAFVPEAAWSDVYPAYPMSPMVGQPRPPGLTSVQRTRIALSVMSAAWWSGHIFWESGFSVQGGSPVLQFDYSNSLAAVTAELAARDVLGDGYFHREQDLRSHDLAKIIDRLSAGDPSFDLPQQPSYVREAADMGLIAVQSFSLGYDSLGITNLIPLVGARAMTAMLQTMAADPTVTANDASLQSRVDALLNVPSPTYLSGVSCPISSHCLAVGSGGDIEATTDGGASWHTQVSGTGADLTGISCASATHCVVVGYNPWPETYDIVLTTADAGRSWHSYRPNIYPFNWLSAVSCASVTQCVAVGYYGTIAATADGGATWELQNPGTRDMLLGVACSSASTCVAIGSPHNPTFGVNPTAVLPLTTHDGGKTWQLQRAGTHLELSGIACASSSRCVAVGGGGAILTSGDGGHSWHEVPSPVTTSLLAVSCHGDNRCVAVGYGSAVLSRDGGVTWNSVPVGTGGVLDGIDCPSRNSCVAVGWGVKLTVHGLS